MSRRYTAGYNSLRAGAYAFPVIPLAIVSGLYPYQNYTASWGDVVLLWLVGLFVSYAMIGFHEFGHALVGRLVGLDITSVTIGHWRRLVEFQFAGATITVRAAPETGYVSTRPNLNSFSPWRTAPFFLAGEAFEILIVAGCALCTNAPAQIDSFADLTREFLRVSVFWIGGVQSIYSLVPRNGWVGGRLMQNDGLQLLNLWKNRGTRENRKQTFLACQEIDAEFKREAYGKAIARTEKLMESQENKTPWLHLVAQGHMKSGDTQKAESIWRALLQRSDLPAAQRAEFLDHLACLPLYFDRNDLLQEIDQWSSTALQLAPEALTLQGTRGAVLVELGKASEGAALLRVVYRKSEAIEDRILAASYLSLSSAITGDSNAADHWLSIARKLKPNHTVVQRIERKIASSQPSTLASATTAAAV